MSAWVMTLLGGFTVQRDEHPLTAFDSGKTRGLLAYLVMERGRAHRRETLLGLFWPDVPETLARRSLNQAVYNLRRLFLSNGDMPLLVSDRYTLQLNPDFTLSLDVVAFESAIVGCGEHRQTAQPSCQVCRETLARAASLYSGPLLAGFTLNNCPEFEEWLILQRERLERQFLQVLQQLATCYEAQGQLDAAMVAARRWAEQAPWQETAHQRVMRLMALAGHRHEALAYYDVCCRILQEEIGVEPRQSTRWLVEDIRTGRIRSRQPTTAVRPLNLNEVAKPADFSPPEFVGRDGQLADLHKRLKQALAGDGQIVFVAGEAGSGKSVLLDRFARQAHTCHPGLIVAWGQGNVFAGSGDPYFLFRQVIGLLLGEAQRGYELGLLSKRQAQRLWSALPMAVDVLVSHSPDLIDAFVPGVALIAQVSTAVEGQPDWLVALRTELEKKKNQHAPLNRGQRLQEQTVNYLRAFSTRCPLLLLLDDLQWTDVQSASLLFQLSRSLAGQRLMVVGAYRQEEVDIGRDGGLHPLKPLLAEHKRFTGVPALNLDRLDESERREFIDQLIDAERNQLDAVFRQHMFEYTEGHALFTVETLSEFKARGDIIWQEEHGWVQHRAPDWGAVPSRAEGVVEMRIDRLPPALKEILAVASVEGEVFSAQIVAAVLDRHLHEIVGGLSGDLERVHRLTAEAGTMQVSRIQHDRFRFRHGLFRQHVYDAIGDTMRRLLHRRVGATLEESYGDQTAKIAPQLALHFDLAGEAGRALPYYLQAGDQARLLYASEQAIQAYKRALALAESLGDGEQAARTHMRLGLSYHNALNYGQAQAYYTQGFQLWSRVAAIPAVSSSLSGQPLRIIWHMAPRNEEPTFDFIPDLFSGLVEETPGLEIVPDIAYRWEIEDEGKKYRFHLRDDVFWSDGQPVTAHDFAFAWHHNYTLTPSLGKPLYNLKGGRVLDYGAAADLHQADVEVPDPYTLLITLSQPAAYFLHLLSNPMAGPKPQHVVACHGQDWATAEHIVCNGPYLLERWDAQDDRMHFVRNPDYHGRAAGNVDRIEAMYFRQPSGGQSHLTLYDRDVIDILSVLNWNQENFELARRRHLSDYVQYPLFVTFAFCFDTTRPPFHDVRVRRAFAMALDRDGGHARFGTENVRPAYGGFIPPGMPGHSPEIGLSHDPERARQLLAEAGYPGGRGFPAVELVQFYAPAGDGPIRFYTQQWRQNLGVSVTYRFLEWTAYWRYLAQAAPQITAMNGFPIYGDPDTFMRQSFRTVQKLSGWHHPGYDRLISHAGCSPNPVERVRLYQQADALLIAEAPIFPIIYNDAAFLTKPRIRYMPHSPVAAGTFWKDVVLASP